MANNYYTFGGPFIPNTKVRSGQVNPEFAGVEAGFDLLPSASDAITRGVVELGIDVQGGTVNEFDVAMPDTRLSNQEGDLVVFRATHTNDGPAVINVDTIGDIAAVEFDGSAFAGGEIVTGRVYEFRYDNANTQFVLSQSSDAENKRIAAEDWAIRPEDDPVPVSSGGDGATTFSALHWSAKSAAFGGGLDFAGDHDGTSGDPASPATGNPLYRIITGAGVITGAGTVEVGDDIYWNGVDWNRINNQAQSATVQGTSVDDPTAPGSFDAQFQWQNANGDPLADVGYNSDQLFALINRVHGGGLRLAGENGAGSVETYLTGSPGAGTLLMFAGVQKFATAADSIIINDSTTNDPTAGLTQTVNIDARNGSFAPVFHVGHQGGVSLDLKNFVHTNAVSVRILGEQSSGAEELFATFGFTGGVELYDQGDLTVGTNQFGLDVTSQSPQSSVIVTLGIGAVLQGEIFGGSGEFAIEGGIDIESIVTIYATDTALNEVIMATFDAQNGPVTLNHSDAAGTVEVAISTTALGADVRAPTGIVPTLTLTEASTVVATLDHEILASGSDFLRLRNEVDSGHLQIRGRSSVSGDALMANFDPDGPSTLYWDEAQRVRTGQFGPEFIGSSATGTTVRFFGSNGTTLIATMGLGGGATNSISGVANVTNNGQPFQVDFPDAGGVNRVGFRFDPDAGAELHTAGVRMLLTETNHLRLIPTVTNNLARVEIRNLLNVSTQADLGFNGTDNLELRNFVDSGHVEVRANTSASAEVLLANFDADAGSFLRHTDGLIRLRSATTGVNVRGDGAASANLTIEGSAGAALLHFDVTTEYQVRGFENGNSMRFTLDDAGGATRDTLLLDPDADVKLYQVGVEVARTNTAALGGLFANNSATGAGFERVLTTSDGIVTATTTELADITDNINTDNRKIAGFEVFNTTTSIVVWAVGLTDGAVWVDATGATAHTPV